MTCGGQKRFIAGLHSNRRQASASSSSKNTNKDSSSSSTTSSLSLLAYLFSSASSSCSSASSTSSISIITPPDNHLSKNGSTPTTTTGTSSHRITTEDTTNCHQSECGDPESGRKGHVRVQKQTTGTNKCLHHNNTTTTTKNNNNSATNNIQKHRTTTSTSNKNPSSTENRQHCGGSASLIFDLNSSTSACATTTRPTGCERGRTECTSPVLSTSCWKPLSIMARKRDDKSPARNCGDRQERKMESYLADDENYPSFSKQVLKLGLQLRDIPADGNCLFRALGDQLEGHGRNHYSHRLKVVDYMSKNKKDFAPFVEDNIQFEHYLYSLKKPGTYAGNDAIAAFARLHQVHIVIHQLNSPFLLIQGTKDPTTPQLHIAYHNGDHYSSLRWLHDNTESPANIRLKIFTDDKNKTNKAKISSKPIYRDEKSGMARVVRDAKTIEQEVIGATGCQDREKIQKCLLDNSYDVDATISDLLNLLKISQHEEKSISGKKASQGKSSESGLWGDKGSGSRLFGNMSLNSSSSSTTSSSSSSLRKSKDSSVHYTEDCMSESSGYGSLGSGSNSGARPKLFIPRVRVL